MDKFPLLKRFNLDDTYYISKVNELAELNKVEPNFEILPTVDSYFKKIENLKHELKTLKIAYYDSKLQDPIEPILEKQKEMDEYTSKLDIIRSELFDFLDHTGFASDYYYNLFANGSILKSEETRKTFHNKMGKSYGKYCLSLKKMERDLNNKYIEDVDRVISGIIKQSQE